MMASGSGGSSADSSTPQLSADGAGAVEAAVHPPAEPDESDGPAPLPPEPDDNDDEELARLLSFDDDRDVVRPFAPA